MTVPGSIVCGASARRPALHERAQRAIYLKAKTYPAIQKDSATNGVPARNTTKAILIALPSNHISLRAKRSNFSACLIQPDIFD
jgi:hypothetical protein